MSQRRCNLCTIESWRCGKSCRTDGVVGTEIGATVSRDAEIFRSAVRAPPLLAFPVKQHDKKHKKSASPVVDLFPESFRDSSCGGRSCSRIKVGIVSAPHYRLLSENSRHTPAESLQCRDILVYFLDRLVLGHWRPSSCTRRCLFRGPLHHVARSSCPRSRNNGTMS